MLQRNALVAVGVVFGAIVVAAIVSYFGKASQDEGSFDKGQRFTAAPGTTRENAMLLTSADRKTTEDPKPSTADDANTPEHEDDPLEVKSLSRKKSEARTGPANDLAVAAVSNISPEAGLRQLDAALALPHNKEQAALLHEARAELYAEIDPPDFEQARLAFDKALEMTEDKALAEEIQHKAVQLLIRAGRDAEALEAANAQLKENPPATSAGFKLQLLQGDLQERAGQVDRAEKSYRAMLEALEAMPENLDPEESVSLARVAALRLTQLCRHEGRDQDAEDVILALKKQITRMQTVPGS